MSDLHRTPAPRKGEIAPMHESLRAEFGDELDTQPAYGEARLWVAARDPRCFFAYWKFRPAEHPAAIGEGGAARFFLRVLRDDRTEEATVEIDPAAGNWFIPVSQPDSSYFAELGFFANSVWCFIARSRTIRTPPEVASSDMLEFFATIPARLSLPKLRELLAPAAVAGEGVAETVSRIQAAAQQQQDEWTPEQELMLAQILSEEMEEYPLTPGSFSSSFTLAQRIHRRLLAAGQAAAPAGPLPSVEEAAPASPGSNWPASPGASWGTAPGK